MRRNSVDAPFETREELESTIETYRKLLEKAERKLNMVNTLAKAQDRAIHSWANKRDYRRVKDMAFLFSRIFRYIIVLYAVFAASQYILRNKAYNVSPKEFRSIAEKSKGEGASAVVKLAADLQRAFGPIITTDLHWNAFQAGGLQLKAMVLHGSLTEFVLAFNAPFATSGRTGFHYANTTCTVLSGEVKRAADVTHSDSVETFAAGANFRLNQFESTLVSLKEKTYVVCYGRGLVPVSSVWSIPQNIIGGDIYSTGRFFYAYAKNSVESIAFAANNLYTHVKKTYLKTEL